MELLKTIEDSLAPLFKQPEMPDGGKKWFVKYLPILALIGGILQAISALLLWQAWYVADNYLGIANDIARSYGAQTSLGRPAALWFWLALTSVVIGAVILLMAYKPLKEKQKKGWDLLLLGSVINVVYAVLLIFVGSGYGGGFSNFIFSLIGSAIGFWILFQIRKSYISSKKSDVK